jgi:transcriptional regulator with XRE-family HTH domain
MRVYVQINHQLLHVLSIPDVWKAESDRCSNNLYISIIFTCYSENMIMPVLLYGKIKPLRQSKGLKQADLAAELGISRPTYVLMERGQKEPTLSQLYTLARLLGVDPGSLSPNLTISSTGSVDYQKFKELVATCLVHGAADDGQITKSKLAILAYLADFAWYSLHSRSLTGMAYRLSPRGPVADDYLRAIDELYEGQSIALEPQGTTMLIRCIEQCPTQKLSEKEISLIHDICHKWRPRTTEEIITFALAQEPAKASKLGDILLYDSVLVSAQESLY